MSPAPARPGLAWIGDWLDAASRLQADAAALQDIGRMLGIGMPVTGVEAESSAPGPAAGVGPAPPVASAPAPAADATDEPGAPAAPAAAPDAAHWRLPSRLLPLPPPADATPAAPPPGWDDLAPLRPQPLVRRAAAPLLARSRRRAVLSALLAETVPEGEPDIARIVASAAGGEPVLRLPRLPRRTLRRGAELRPDSARWLAPYAGDAAELAAYLKRLLPPGRLRVQAIDGASPALPPPRRRATAPPLPQVPRAPVLLLSDLGAGACAPDQPPASPQDWRRWAGERTRSGRRVLALTPRPGPQAPASGIAAWPWDERLLVADAARRAPPRRRAAAGWEPSAAAAPPPVPAAVAIDPEAAYAAAAAALAVADLLDDVPAPVVALAALLAPVQRITPWHLRAARRALRPALPPAAEADFWFSPLVAQRGVDALVLEPEVRRALLAALAQEAGPVRAAALALLRRGWAGRGDVACIEERLLAAEIDGRLDEAAAAALLAPALKALVAPPGAAAAREVAGWAVHAWHRFSPALQRTEAARLLAFAAARHLQPRVPAGADAAPPRAAAMLADDAGRLPALPSAGAWAAEVLGAEDAPVVHVSLELRRHADGSTNLVIGPARPPTTALHRIALPLAGPPWLQVRHPGQADGGTPLHEVVAVDPFAETRIEVPDADAASPLELTAGAGTRWQLWPAGSLQEAVLAAFLHHEPGVTLLLLDASRALLWPSARPAPHEDVARLQELAFVAWNGQLARVRPLGTLGMPGPASGLAVVQVLEPPDGAVPIDPEAWDRPIDPPPTGALQPYLGIPAFESLAEGGSATPVGLAHVGEGRYRWDDALPQPGLLLPGHAREGAMLVLPDEDPLSRQPVPLRQLQRDARALSPPLWCALVVGLPGAEGAALTVYDTLLGAVGSERCVHDMDGRLLAGPESRAGLLRRCDLVVVVGHASPDDAAAAVIGEAAELGKRLGWLPLAALAPGGDGRVPPPPGWPPRLARLIARQPPLSQAQSDIEAARSVLAVMDERTIEGEAPQTPPDAPPVVPPVDGGFSVRAMLLKQLDTRTDAEIGLHRVVAPARSGEPVRFEPVTAWPEGSEPALLLVHGELSDTEASFGALWARPDDAWLALRARYGEHVYAWRWRTAKPGIARNARLLMQALPKDDGSRNHRPAHVLTLGAGGLLVEFILAMAKAGGVDAQAWAARAWPALPLRRRDELALDADLRPRHGAYDDRDAFEGWTAYAFYAGKPKIERFVRVACPAAGTPLVGRGADRVLGALRATVGLVPGLGMLRTALPATLLNDPAAAPGLAGLMPGAGVLPLLTTDVVTDVPLVIVAGAVRWGESTLGWLKSWLPRLAGLGPGDNDLVVPLASAFGGIERSAGVDWLLEMGPEATHFDFFTQERTRRAIADALLAPPGQTPPGFRHETSLAALQRQFGPAPA